MKFLDTVVLIGVLDPGNELHKTCLKHLDSLSENALDTFVPMASILEADLAMEGKKYTHEERRMSWEALRYRITSERIASNSVSSLVRAADLQEGGMDYFDSLISSIALENEGAVVTTDKAIKDVVATEW